MNDIPKVLLLGNGLNRAFGGESWEKLMGEIKSDSWNAVDLKCLQSPEPLRAIIVTRDHVDTAIKQQKGKMLGTIQSQEQMAALRSVLNLKFDHVLTTNYGYELEAAAAGQFSFSEKQALKHQKHTTADQLKRAENKYLLHTYEEVMGHKIWHIHGEVRKADSMILGHFYYGNLLFQIKTLLEKRKNSYERVQKEGKTTEIGSWVDVFILGNVYILGFGFGLSEFDLWWLLNRRKREKAQTGNIYFYEAKPAVFNERLDLLQLLGVTIVDCGFHKEIGEDNKEHLCGDYKEFYLAAIKDMEYKMHQQTEPKKTTEIQEPGEKKCQ